MNFRGATVGGGTIAFASGGGGSGAHRLPQPAYDLEGATLGRLSVHAPDADTLEVVRVLGTRFEGFDFEQLSEGRQVLALEDNDHDLHTLAPAASTAIALGRATQTAATDLHAALEDRDEDLLGAVAVDSRVDFEAVEREGVPAETADRATTRAHDRLDSMPSAGLADPTVEELEKTYLEAKNGADAAGNSHSAGRFFEKERVYRRTAHWNAAWAGPVPDVRRLSRWVRSGALAVTCGYGERPWRVIGSSLLIVGIFAAYYALATGLSGESGPPPFDIALFSFQSFITFLIGGPPQPPDLAVQVASSVEGFVGAFFVALFVFALTRQIHR